MQTKMSELKVPLAESVSVQTPPRAKGKPAAGFDAVPQDVLEELILPATKTLGAGHLSALAATSKAIHTHAMRALAIPLAATVRKEIIPTGLPAEPEAGSEPAVAKSKTGRPKDLGAALHALRRLKDLFVVRGFDASLTNHETYGPWRGEAWCRQQLDRALQEVLEAPVGSRLRFFDELPEAMMGLRAAAMRPLLSWAASNTAVKYFFGESIAFAVNEAENLAAAIASGAERQMIHLRADMFQISQLPPLGSLGQHLRSLELSNCIVPSLPLEMAHMTNLKVLDLNGSLMTDVESPMRLPGSLEELNLEASQVGPIEFQSDPVFLEKLNLGDMNASELPNCLSKCIQLKELNITNNPNFGGIPVEIYALSNLKKLSAMSNGIAVLDDRILALEKLETLNLGHNSLGVFPDVLTRMKNLKRLNLKHNGISYLSPLIAEMTQLEELSLDVNNIDSIPKIF